MIDIFYHENIGVILMVGATGYVNTHLSSAQLESPAFRDHCQTYIAMILSEDERAVREAWATYDPHVTEQNLCCPHCGYVMDECVYPLGGV
jgi:hypothetical protein